MNEQLLLFEASEGKECAFKELFDYYKTYVYSIAIKILKTKSHSEDVLQEVFLKIWLNRSKLSEIDNFKGYITTITSHHIYNLLRRQAYENLYAKRFNQQKEAFQYELNDYAFAGETSRFYTDLEKGISSLTQQQQKVFRLSRIDGLKHSEIASLLHISKETVKKHIMSSLQIVRTYMNQYNNLEKILLLFLLLLK